MQAPGLRNQYFFLAALLKKPRLHVLLQGFEVAESDEVISILDPNTGAPSACTSHQAFQRMISLVSAESSAPLPQQLGFVQHKYELNPFTPLTQVRKVQCVDGLCFSSKPAAKPAKKRRTPLPFGLSKPARPRKRRAKATAASDPEKQRSLSFSFALASAPEIEQELAQETALQQSRLPQRSASKRKLQEVVSSSDERSAGPGSDGDLDSQFVPADSDSSSDSSRASSSSDSDSSDDSADSALSDSDQELFQHVEPQESRLEVEEPVLTPAQAKEEAVVLDLLSSRAASIVDADQGQPRPAAASKSFCNPRIGLVDAGTQVSRKRALCRQCLQHIEVGSVRFAYAFSLTRFSCWLHDNCTVEHLLQESANLRDSARFLEGISQQVDGPAKDVVRKAAAKLAAELAGHMAN